MVRNSFEFLFFFSMGGGGFLVYLMYLANGNGKKSGDSGYCRNAHSIKMSRTVSDQNERTNSAAFYIRPALSPK